ncbi:peptidase inhibitor family I36 protein [Bacillus sp. BRMEA1]|uniref:peptidase inhibitor family I36 protein n=1 Tax=Neobacillus endophyticus TaxID=2738405 RepID=UPI0015657F91|nr:peptidase inhibitor family I36 protein [Neobacillus endophyticus]NRD77859.1 peptidase inhibitor family I36 protein [Neobacillus endophyticus]
MKKIVMALLTFILVVIPISAFAATTPASVSKQMSSTQSMVQLKGVPIMINGVKYTQADPHVKNVTDFVFDDSAKSKGVIYGFTSKNNLNAYLKSAVAARNKNMQNNAIAPRAVYYNSYFYQDINYGGNSFGASSNISWVGSYWNDKISSLTAGYNHNWTVLCWDINYGGSRFWVESGINVSYVGSTWNDQASSIFFSN